MSPLFTQIVQDFQSKSRAIGNFSKSVITYGKELLTPRPNTSWRTIHCRLSTTVYSIYPHPPSILKAVPPSATSRCVIPWSQGLNYRGVNYTCSLIPNSKTALMKKQFNCRCIHVYNVILRL